MRPIRGAEPLSAPAATEDRLLGGRIVLRQPAHGFRVAIDSVLLAAAVDAAGGGRVLELGSGVGAAALCLARRLAECRIVGLEQAPELVALAEQNARRNGLVDRLAFRRGDVAAPPAALGDDFEQVMMNPPYLSNNQSDARVSFDPAMVEGAVPLAAWIAAAQGFLRRSGTLTVIHRADRLDELLALMRGPFGGIEVLPLWPRAGTAARRVVVRARRGLASPARLAPGLVLHRPDGGFTPEADHILRDGGALSW